MALEIERKFLVDPSKWTPADHGTQLIQAYLSLDPNPVVRIRIAGGKAFLTVKGLSESISRPEYEYEIPADDADGLMKMAITDPVEKKRYQVMVEGFLWEIDVFSGKNEGLIMAEIELETEYQDFPRPDWLLQEVSGDIRFFNAFLSEHPFQEWSDTMA